MVLGHYLATEPQLQFVGTNTLTECAVIPFARQRLMIPMLRDPGLDLALWVDDDVWWHPMHANRVAELLLTVGWRAAVLAGVNYPTRTMEPTVQTYSRGERKPVPFTLSPTSSGLSGCARLGTGLMAMDLRWYRERWPIEPGATWFSVQSYMGPETEGGEIELETHGEDYWHCDGVCARGGTLMYDPHFPVNNGNAIHPADRHAARRRVSKAV